MLRPEQLCALGCALLTTGLVVAEFQRWGTARSLCKIGASTLMVLLAVSLNPAASAYGLLVLAALVLSWMGDACLLSERRAWFLAGLGSFLLAHLTYSVAFVIGDVAPDALLAALFLLFAAGAATLRWLWRYLGRFERFAVSAYALTIVAMCSLAMARSAATHSWWAGIAALAFAASDLSVARDRFIKPSPLNRAWGLPTYYAAQLLFGWTVAP